MNKFFEKLFDFILGLISVVVRGTIALSALYIICFPITIPITLLIIIILILVL